MVRRTLHITFATGIEPETMPKADWEASEHLLAQAVLGSISIKQGRLKNDENQTKGDDQDVRELDTGRED